MQFRVFCESDHHRVPMFYMPDRQQYGCEKCMARITDEAAYRSIPKLYSKLLSHPAGELVASMMDIGAIDLIYTGRPILSVEYPRENQV